MDEYLVLQAQINAICKDISRASEGISILKQSSVVSPNLSENLYNKLCAKLHERDQDIEELKKDVKSRLSIDICWCTLGQISRDLHPIFSECLAVMQGCLSRERYLDDGLCKISDCLLEYLNNKAAQGWHCFTILDIGESYESIDDIIRISFPGDGIWSLPAAAHEFGHFVGNQLLQSNEIDISVIDLSWVASDKEKERKKRHILELFADLFATYALGPSYGYMSILLRFNPFNARADTKTHPSDTNRAFIILEELKKINNAHKVDRPFGTRVDDLDKFWKISLSASGQTYGLGEIGNELDSLLYRWHILLRKKMPQLNYNNFDIATQISDKFEKANSPNEILDELSSCTPVDVLNATWIYRNKFWDDKAKTETVGRKAIDLCKEIANKGIAKVYP